ncbi:MAG TPA: septation protein SepH [Pseudonocardiaceae bacterium]
MRALRVVGLDEAGVNVVVEDAERRERFTIPLDERLRAAVRGDLPRIDRSGMPVTTSTENTNPMRPREIQARIRAGESVEQVAAAAGMPVHRIERFAYPVLLERSRIAELAQNAHPVREDGPDVQTLGEVVAHAFSLRGQDYSAARWDAWRGEDGKWTVQLRWNAGRSDNRAHWVYHPGAQGGTVTALDELAADLLDPSPTRPLRTVRPVTRLAQQALRLDEPERLAAAAPDGIGPVISPDPVVPAATRPVEQEAVAAATAAAPEPTAPDDVGAETPLSPPTQQSAAKRTEQAVRRGRRTHPIVPSWEDVLLGVRSQRG